MGSRKLIFIIALQLVLEGCRVFSQYIQGAQTCTCASPGAIIPAGQFVIPAIIKPILQPDVAVQNTAPAVPSYPGDFSGFGGFPGFPGAFPGSFPGGFPGGYPGGFSGGYPGGFPGGLPGGFPGPYGGMPPIIFEDDDDRSSTWLYWLILALSRRGRFGGGNFGYGDSYGYGCGGGNYGNCGGCGGGYGGNGCGCGNCANGGGYGGCNGVGFGGFGGFSGNNCGCGNGCTYIPYPVPVPCGSSISGYPNFECPTDENVPNPGNQQPTEINVIFRNSDQQPQ